MATIEEKLIETLKIENQKFQDDPQIKEFEEASNEFKNMIERGVTKERGYNLLSVENVHLTKVQFNVTQ